MWALDLGTTNSVLTRWDRARQSPVMVELPAICRFPPSRALPAVTGEEAPQVDPLAAPLVIPTVVEPYDALTFWARLGRWPAIQRLVFLGNTAFIGRAAVERSRDKPRPGYASSFKPYLGTSPLRTISRIGRTPITARECLRLFLRELLAEAAETTSERIRDLVVTSPVDAYESYRAEVSQALKDLGVRRVRFIDEPVAAALGYGLGVNKARNVLVVDFGGGTMDVAYVKLSPETMNGGTAEVIGKDGRPIGGTSVDRWILQKICQDLGYSDPFERSDDDWRRHMLESVCAAKEQLFFDEETTLVTVAPDELQRFEERIRGYTGATTLTRDGLIELLAEHGVYRELEACIDTCVDDDDEVDDVLMVGGSTLLPGVYKAMQDRFGRDRVRAWQPFEAVAQGACVFAAGKAEPTDFIVHDYAFVTHDLRTHEKQYAIVVPRGTRFPTTHDFWRKELVPTCSLGEPETMFKLVICELGRAHDGSQRFAFDQEGKVHVLRGTPAGTAASSDGFEVGDGFEVEEGPQGANGNGAWRNGAEGSDGQAETDPEVEVESKDGLEAEADSLDETPSGLPEDPTPSEAEPVGPSNGRASINGSGPGAGENGGGRPTTSASENPEASSGGRRRGRPGWRHAPDGVIPADQVVVVSLNESNPTLGYLRPPHPPENKEPRLEISFGVNADRWLCATVFDLQTKKYMMREEPVVRLM